MDRSHEKHRAFKKNYTNSRRFCQWNFPLYLRKYYAPRSDAVFFTFSSGEKTLFSLTTARSVKHMRHEMETLVRRLSAQTDGIALERTCESSSRKELTPRPPLLKREGEKRRGRQRRLWLPSLRKRGVGGEFVGRHAIHYFQDDPGSALYATFFFSDRSHPFCGDGIARRIEDIHSL